MNELAGLQPFLISLGLGLLIGLERQRSPSAHAGLRTFPLVALLGTVCAMLDARLQVDAMLLPAGLLLVGATMILSYRQGAQDADPGTTTTVAVLVCYALGALSWLGEYQFAVGCALATTALLHFKDELHGFAARLSREDVVAVLRFVVLSVLLLPLLPDRGYGPYGALNPYRLWWMVVLISGLSLGGYLLLRLVGSGRSVPLLGVLGGLASSTATTLSFSRHARANPAQIPAAAAVILLANLTVLLRLSVLGAVVAPAVLPSLLPAMVGGLAGGGAFALSMRRHGRQDRQPTVELSNPGELRAAFGFAALYAAVLLAVSALQDRAGSVGLYAVAAVSGLTDVDAISLSVLNLLGSQRLEASTVTGVMLTALLANLVFKGMAAAGIAGRVLARPLGFGFAAIAAGALLGRALGAVISG